MELFTHFFVIEKEIKKISEDSPKMNYVERGLRKRRTQIAMTHRTRQVSWRSTRGSGMTH